MKHISKLFLFVIFIFLMMISCKPDNKDETKVELCVGNYLTEDEGAKKLLQLAANYQSAKDWKMRSNAIKQNIIQGAGLDKKSEEEWNYTIKVTKGQLHRMDGYTVESIALEVKPDYFITGNLYQPLELAELNPAILSTHGHWFDADDYGRFRPDMQKRCASLAKMGSVVFAYDMYGTGEDTQHVHLSPESLSMQCYNGIRILDYICSLDYVDETKIGITGASGGGTQAFLVAAIDERIDVSVPVVMVSAHFYGGCLCESGMPVHKKGLFETNNVEIAASIAPKPLMIIGDGDDWTKNIPDVEFPFIHNIYELFGAGENAEYAYFKDEVHDYGFSKRKAAYGFLAKHLKLDLNRILDGNGEINEDFVVLLDTTQLKVFPDRALVAHPMAK